MGYIQDERIVIKLKYEDRPGRIHYCENCGSMKIYEKPRLPFKCKCGSQYKVISSKFYGNLLIIAFSWVIKKYLLRISKLGDNFITKMLMRSDMRGLSRSILHNDNLSLKINIKKPKGFKRIIKEMRALIHGYNWETFEIIVNTEMVELSYKLSKIGDWHMSINLQLNN